MTFSLGVFVPPTSTGCTAKTEATTVQVGPTRSCAVTGSASTTTGTASPVSAIRQEPVTVYCYKQPLEAGQHYKQREKLFFCSVGRAQYFKIRLNSQAQQIYSYLIWIDRFLAHSVPQSKPIRLLIKGFCFMSYHFSISIRSIASLIARQLSLMR